MTVDRIDRADLAQHDAVTCSSVDGLQLSSAAAELGASHVLVRGQQLPPS